MYKPLRFFTFLGLLPFMTGVGIGIRYIIFILMGNAGGHVQSLILASILILLGVMCEVIGVLADVIAANRKILEDIQYHVRKISYESNQDE